MILGSHNSWSYLPPKKWWMKPFRFIAQCQDLSILEQYEHGVRCFDLRLRAAKKNGWDDMNIVHGKMVYDISYYGLREQLDWLDKKGDVYVRVIHDVRNKSQYTSRAVELFKIECARLEQLFPNIKFWCGENLYNHKKDYEFKNNPTCAEYYSSVVLPKIDDVYPRHYAKKNTKAIYEKGTDKEILLLDFVNYITQQ